MDRSSASRAVSALLAILCAALPLAVVALVRALPPLRLEPSGLAWVPMALGGVLALAGVSAAVVTLGAGLQRRSLAILLAAGSSAAIASGALGVAAGAAPMPVVLLGAAAMLAGAVAGRDGVPLPDRRAALLAAAAVALGAELLVIAGLVPAIADLLAPARVPLLVVAIGLAGFALVAAFGSLESLAAALIAVGVAGIALDRGGTIESIAGLAALVGGQALMLARGLEPVAAPPRVEEERLPELADRLSEGVLRFDGHLQLRDWNRPAAELLGLDAASTGVRAEDLLGVSLGQLPRDDAVVIMGDVVGGLEIALHRSGDGMIAILRDPGAVPESDRLGGELRSTIEELLRARRTIDLQRGELERSATVDALTGVSSRAAIIERIRIEVTQARRYRHPLALVLIDIDHLGVVNHFHGIAGGDTVLREVALRFRLRVREADALGRYGSDGFIAALPHTDDEGAANFASALRHRLALRPIAVGEVLVPITVSVGVATMREGEELDLNGILARVEEALESARSAGGDRIALDRLHGFARLEDRRGRDADPGLDLPGRGLADQP